MTWTMALVVVALAIFGGLLAYWGDLLGRRFGKRRLTLFGIRPKYTAIIITSANGAALVLFTVVAMTVINESFRVWITRGDRIVSELSHNAKELRDLQEERASLGQQVDDLARSLDTRRKELAKLQAEYGAKAKEVEQLVGRLASAQAELAQSERQLVAEQSEIRRLRSEQRRLMAQITTAQNQAQEANQRLLALREDIRTAETRNEDLLAEYEDQSLRNVTLERENAALERQNLTLKQDNSRLEADNERIRQENQTVKNEAAKLRAEYGELVSGAGLEFATLRRQPLVYGTGEEIQRISVNPTIGRFRIEQQIREALDSSGEKAQQMGAEPNDKGRTVFIPDKAPQGSQDIITEQESIDAIVDQIGRSDGLVAALVVSLINTVRGEPVPVEIRLFRNPLVFSKGGEIASESIEPHSSAQALTMVLQFLKDEVRSRAIDKGLIPRFDPRAEEPFIGELPGDQLLDLATSIARLGGKVRIIAKASDDIRAADPLRLSFEVRRER